MAQPTMQDIANALGVSKMTVSRALRGVGRVKDSTREDVRRMARELGYLQSPQVVLGQPAHRGTSDHSLHLLLPSVGPSGEILSGPIAEAVLRGIRERLALNAGRLDMLPCANVDEIITAWHDLRASGVVLREQLPARWVSRLQQWGPVVYASSHDFYPDVDAVYTNELRSAARVQSYLHRCGCRRIAWFGLFDRHVADGLPHAFFADMTERERERFSIHGPRYAAWTYLAHGSTGDRVHLGERDWRTDDLGTCVERGVDAMLADAQRPTAVVAPTGGMAWAIIGALEARGLSVPSDISVVGYDYRPTSGADGRRLTTVLLPMYDIGRAVPDLIERRLAAPDALPLTILFQTYLEDGDTVRPLPPSN